MTSWITRKSAAAIGIMFAAGALGAACSSDPEDPTASGSATGTGGQGGESSSQSSGSAQSASAGSTGQGGAGGGQGGAGGAGEGGSGQGGSAAGCAPGASASLKNDVQPIFTQSCGGMNNGCHFKPAPSAGLSLKDGEAHKALLNKASMECDGATVVTAGKPEESFLINKLQGVELCGSKAMPLNQPKLPDDKIEIITNWICGGALDN